jgi:hypothetical protein
VILLVPAAPEKEELKQPPVASPNALIVQIRREPFSPTFVLTLSNGNSEEVDCGTESHEWFKRRGADMKVVEKALDYAYNFYRAEVVINSPKSPVVSHERVKPRV